MRQETVMTLKFYASVAKGLKLKDRKFWELIPTFVKVTREKMAGYKGKNGRGWGFCSPYPEKD